jgi:tetratricopeptide (TPR) repeat protein
MKKLNDIGRLASVLTLTAVATLAAVGPSLAHPEVDRQISDLTRRMERDGASAELYLRRAELHRVHRDRKAALADLSRARKADPGLAIVDYFVARIELESGKLKPAAKHIERFLGEQPAHAGGLTIRARIAMEQGRTADAIRDFSRAIDGSHDARPDPALYLERARAQATLGGDAIAAAIEGLDQGAARLGRPITLLQYAIELELERGNHEGAIDRIDRLAANAARQEGWHLRRAEIYEDAGRPEEARRQFEAALAAVDRLPESRRRSRAMQRLQDEARGGLERLAASAQTETP